MSGAGSAHCWVTTMDKIDIKWLITFVAQLAVGLTLVTVVEGGREFGLSLLGMATGQGLTAQMTAVKKD